MPLICTNARLQHGVVLLFSVVEALAIWHLDPLLILFSLKIGIRDVFHNKTLLTLTPDNI